MHRTLAGLSLWLAACAVSVDAPPGPLVRVDDVAPGSDCEAGGAAIHAGVDDDGDGVLDDDEIDTTELVCSGVDGVDGEGAAPSLIDTEPEPAGENCPDGGTAVHTGVDDDGDGVLDPEEIDATAWVCDGAGSTATLVRLDTIAAGGVCGDATGATLSVGRDDDGDGVLDPDEIDESTTVCDGTTPIPRLVDVEEDPPGSPCAEGGIAVHTGPDTDGSGTLDPGEIDGTVYVCDGLDGVSVLTRVDPVSSGGACGAEAGAEIHTGIDDDGDGVLDDAEIDSTVPVCDGADTSTRLIRVDDEPPGANCTEGGIAVHTGPDLDGSGALDPGEEDATRYVCDGAASGAGGLGITVIEGDYTVTNYVAAGLLIGVEEVTGTLTVESADLTTFQTATSLRSVGDFIARQSPSLEVIELSSLESTVGNFQVVDCDALATLRTPSLSTVGGGLSIEELALLETIALPALHDVAGHVELRALPGTTTIDLSGMVALQSDLIVWEVPALQALDLSELATAAGIISIAEAASLPSVSLPRLTGVEYPLAISNLAGATSIEAPMLTSAGSLRLDFLPALTSLVLHPDFDATDQVEVCGHALTSLSMPGLTSPRSIKLCRSDALVSASFPSLTSVEWHLRLTELGSFTTLDAPLLQSIGLDLDLEDLDQVTVFSLPQLADISRSLDVFDSPLLEEIDLGGITRLPTYIDIVGVPALDTFDTSGITDLGDSTRIRLEDTGLTSFELSQASSDGYLNFFEVIDNASLQTVDVTVAEIEGFGASVPYVTASGNDALATLHVAATVGGLEESLVADNPLLQTLTVPVREQSAVITLSGMPQLTSITFVPAGSPTFSPSFVTFEDLDALTNLDSLSGVDVLQNGVFDGNALLSDLTGLMTASVQGQVSFLQNPSLCREDVEAFATSAGGFVLTDATYCNP